MFRVDILSARAAWLGSGWGWALECSFEYLYCFHPDCPCSHMASPEPRRAAVGRRHGERDKPAPCFKKAGPYAHFGGPRSRPSPSAGRLRCAGEPEGRKESGSEAGPRNLQNNERGSYSSTSCISFPPPPPGPAPAPSRPQPPPAKTGQNQKEFLAEDVMLWQK